MWFPKELLRSQFKWDIMVGYFISEACLIIVAAAVHNWVHARIHLFYIIRVFFNTDSTSTQFVSI